MPGAVYRSASRDLGPVERRHRSPWPVRSVAIIVAVFGAPGVALLTGFQSARGQVFAGDRATNAAIGAALSAFALWCVVQIVKKSSLAVVVHANGLRWREGGRERSIPWSEIEHVRTSRVKRLVSNVEVARTTVGRITLEDGREYVATNLLADVGELLDRVEREVALLRLPRESELLERGEARAFGPITVGPRGIELGARTVGWSELERLEISDGKLVVRAREGAALEVDWSALPNARLLVALVRARAASAGETAREATEERRDS